MTSLPNLDSSCPSAEEGPAGIMSVDTPAW